MTYFRLDVFGDSQPTHLRRLRDSQAVQHQQPAAVLGRHYELRRTYDGRTAGSLVGVCRPGPYPLAPIVFVLVPVPVVQLEHDVT